MPSICGREREFSDFSHSYGPAGFDVLRLRVNQVAMEDTLYSAWIASAC
jgi:hypothetical protein